MVPSAFSLNVTFFGCWSCQWLGLRLGYFGVQTSKIEAEGLRGGFCQSAELAVWWGLTIKRCISYADVGSPHVASRICCQKILQQLPAPRSLRMDSTPTLSCFWLKALTTMLLTMVMMMTTRRRGGGMTMVMTQRQVMMLRRMMIVTMRGITMMMKMMMTLTMMTIVRMVMVAIMMMTMVVMRMAMMNVTMAFINIVSTASVTVIVAISALSSRAVVHKSHA